jgi:serine/threonine protein kinase
MVGPDLSGTVLNGRYRLGALLGMGGMGQVYRGTHLTLGRTVAIKILPAHIGQDPRSRARFAREARAVAKIAHRNVVQIMDYGDSPDGPVYFVMEFLEGRDLGGLLRHEGRLPWPRTRHLLLQAISALGAAHAYGIVHRDIKPNNCFVLDLPHEGHTDVVKLLDFGIAKILTPDEYQDSSPPKQLTGTGEIVGTASYMAPEQARGEPLDPRSDVYSLGIMAYEMLTGRVPFTGANAIQIVTRHLYDRPEPLRTFVPDLDPEVEAIVLRAIAKDPRHRFDSMAAMQSEILAIRSAGSSTVHMRALASNGSARVDGGAMARVSGMRDDVTVMLRKPSSWDSGANAHEDEDSFEAAVTPKSPVLRPRFGEPFPLRAKGDEALADEVREDEAREGEARDDEALEDEEREVEVPPEPETPSAPKSIEVQSSRARLALQQNPSDIDELEDGTTKAHVSGGRPAIEDELPALDLIRSAVCPSEDLTIEDDVVAARVGVQEEPVTTRWRGWRGVIYVVLLSFLAGGILVGAWMFPRELRPKPAPAEAAALTDTREPSEPSRTPASPRDVVVPAVPDHAVARGAEELEPGAREAPDRVDLPTEESPATSPEAPVPAPTETTTSADASPKAGEVRAATKTRADTRAKPSHTSEDCATRRKQAKEAHDLGEYKPAIELTELASCWPASQQNNRILIRIEAMINKKDFVGCVRTGEGIKHPKIEKITSECRSRLESSKTGTKNQ